MSRDGMLFEICESCHARMATSLIYFDDGGPTFSVCDSCAEAAAGFYGQVVPFGDDAA